MGGRGLKQRNCWSECYWNVLELWYFAFTDGWFGLWEVWFIQTQIWLADHFVDCVCVCTEIFNPCYDLLVTNSERARKRNHLFFKTCDKKKSCLSIETWIISLFPLWLLLCRYKAFFSLNLYLLWKYRLKYTGKIKFIEISDILLRKPSGSLNLGILWIHVIDRGKLPLLHFGLFFSHQFRTSGL